MTWRSVGIQKRNRRNFFLTKTRIYFSPTTFFGWSFPHIAYPFSGATTFSLDLAFGSALHSVPHSYPDADCFSRLLAFFFHPFRACDRCPGRTFHVLHLEVHLKVGLRNASGTLQKRLRYTLQERFRNVSGTFQERFGKKTLRWSQGRLGAIACGILGPVARPDPCSNPVSRTSTTLVPYLLTSLFIPQLYRDETRIRPRSERIDFGGRTPGQSGAKHQKVPWGEGTLVIEVYDPRSSRLVLRQIFPKW